MANLIDQHMLSVFYDHPNLENIKKVKKTLDLVFKLEKNMTAQVAAMFAVIGPH